LKFRADVGSVVDDLSLILHPGMEPRLTAAGDLGDPQDYVGVDSSSP
jgi:hypothetical protein